MAQKSAIKGPSTKTESERTEPGSPLNASQAMTIMGMTEPRMAALATRRHGRLPRGRPERGYAPKTPYFQLASIDMRPVCARHALHIMH